MSKLQPPLPEPTQSFDLDVIPSEISPSIAAKQPNGYYKLIGDPVQRDHYKVMNRSAPILQQTSVRDVPGIRAVSDTLVFVPEASLTEKNQDVFSNRATYLDRHRIGVMGMTTTLDEVLAEQKYAESILSDKKCVRIDPCPDPPFKDLACCSNTTPSDVPLDPKVGLPRAPLPIRHYGHRDSSWSFMVDRPYDRYAMIIMATAVGIAVMAILVLLIWSMLTG